MVRALLDDRKSQTRRIIKPQPEPWRDYHLEGGCQTTDWHFKPGYYTVDGVHKRFGFWMFCKFDEGRFQPLPIWPGDLLYVREAFHPTQINADHDPRFGYPVAGVGYKADWSSGQPAYKWRPSIHMPKAHSRITLRVTDVRVQRLQDISEEDAKAEGVEFSAGGNEELGVGYRIGFTNIWSAIHGPDAWDRNPWVAAVSFETIKANVDDVVAREAA